MPIFLKRPSEIAQMREAGRIVAEVYDRLQRAIQPGILLRELDRIATEHLQKYGAEPLYKGYRGSKDDHPPFPGVICTAVNEEVCHGIPNNRMLREGDIVGIDIGLKYRGYCGDACVTFPVGKVSAEAQKLLDVTQECLRRGIEAAHVGNRVGDVGAAIQAYAEGLGYSVVEEWAGHGLGRVLHEEFSVPHKGKAGHGDPFRVGMTFTIEPMINIGTAETKLLNDGWTVITADRKLSAQFEHTIVITTNGAEILTQL